MTFLTLRNKFMWFSHRIKTEYSIKSWDKADSRSLINLPIHLWFIGGLFVTKPYSIYNPKCYSGRLMPPFYGNIIYQSCLACKEDSPIQKKQKHVKLIQSIANMVTSFLSQFVSLYCTICIFPKCFKWTKKILQFRGTVWFWNNNHNHNNINFHTTYKHFALM